MGELTARDSPAVIARAVGRAVGIAGWETAPPAALLGAAKLRLPALLQPVDLQRTTKVQLLKLAHALDVMSPAERAELAAPTGTPPPPPEAQAVPRPGRRHSEASLRAAWAELDLDGSGTLGKGEVKELFSNLGQVRTRLPAARIDGRQGQKPI
eukprot:SAG11_NODE_9885_length_872_cov_1.668823_2_plen_154_part_00